MTRVGVFLLVALMGCALGMISSQHHARKLFVQLGEEQSREKQLNVEYGQLQLEQSTWATHARIEQMATRSLGLRLPDAKQVRTLVLPEAAPAAARGDSPAISPGAVRAPAQSRP